MAHEQTSAAQKLSLPVLVFGVVEVRRLIRELDALEEYMVQARLRQSGESQSLPRVSRLSESIATENQLNLLKEQDRQALKDFLMNIEKKAPQLHLSFASDPSSAFMAKLVEWLRTNIHPYALVSLGLQPSIAAGCILRTPNRAFDFSLRQRLSGSAKLLQDSMAASSKVQQPVGAPRE